MEAEKLNMILAYQITNYVLDYSEKVSGYSELIKKVESLIVTYGKEHRNLGIEAGALEAEDHQHGANRSVNRWCKQEDTCADDIATTIRSLKHPIDTEGK